MPGFLAAGLAAFLAAPSVAAADVQMNRLSTSLIEITGGNGLQAWRLRYGTHETFYQARLVPGEGDQAWFIHGNWLRLIDRKKGAVVGRWRFPSPIVNFRRKGNQIEIDVEERQGDSARAFGETIVFDPRGPAIPQWPTDDFMLYRLPLTEASVPWPAVNLSDQPTSGKPTPEQAKALIPQLEEAVRRDTLSPWLRVVLGKTLWDIGDVRAAAEFQQAVQVPTTDFTELLNISAFLEQLGERDAARAAFERGYRDFLERGYDPRLNTGYGRGSIYDLRAGNWGSLPIERRSELVERVYKLSPRAWMSEHAWRVYAQYLARNGRESDSQVWRARAGDATKTSESLWQGGFLRNTETGVLVVLGSLVAGILYVLVLYARYRPQRLLDRAKRRQVVEAPSGPSFFYFQKWTLAEQIGLFLIVAAAWVLGFVKILPPAAEGQGLFAAFLALYFSFAAAVVYIVVVHLRHRRQDRQSLQGPAAGTDAQTFSSLDFRRWGWLKRAAFIAVVIGGWIFGYSQGEPVEDLFIAFFTALAGALVCLLVFYLLDRPRRRRVEAMAGVAPRFAWFNTVYWSTRERLTLLGFAIVASFATGIAGQNMAAIFRIASLPASFSAGSFASPVTLSYLQNRLPAMPERDLLLAFAYQQGGKTDSAERLFRSLPQFPESWNNLGVILKNAGKEQEARAAFDKALQLDPGLSEAAFNLGRPTADFWTEQHKKYLDDRPMLAPPKGERSDRVLLGGTTAQVCMRALAGAFWGGSEYAFGELTGSGPITITVVALGFAFGLVFLLPRREVTQPPGKMQELWDVLCPGASPQWNSLGGLALLAWGYFLIQALLMLRLGSPYFMTLDSVPNLQYAYGVPGTEPDPLLKPNWVWVYLAPAVLFGVNLVLVFRDKLFGKKV